MDWVDLPHYAAFLAAAALLVVIPGPTVLTVCGIGLALGPRRALPVAGAVGLADLTTAGLSALGLGAILAASAALFTAVKWAGTAYLIWMGIKLWRAPVNVAALNAAPLNATPGDATPRDAWAFARQAYWVTALNPKPIVFLAAFMPQFVDPRLAAGPQLALYAVSFALVGTVNAAGWALLSGKLRRLAERPRALRWINRCGGGLMIGAGAATALR